jgi:2,3-dimethylmalate lyase
MKATTQLRTLLAQPGIIAAPSAHDAITAKLAERAGFPALYVGSYAAHATQLGMPDVGLMTMNEMADYCGRIARAVRVPVIADAENGFGDAVKVRRTVREFERAGVAAIHIEDQEWGKHLNVQAKLLDTDAMCGKIKAAVDARTDPDFVIIARTDAAWALGSLDEAIDRGRAYAEAGADMVFLIVYSSGSMIKAASSIPVPLVNIDPSPWGIFTPAEKMERNGIKVILFFCASFYLEYRVMGKLFAALKRNGSLADFKDELPAMEEFDEFLGVTEIENLYGKYTPR